MLIGYNVYFRRHGAIFSKMFGKSYKMDMDSKKELAIQWRDNVLEIINSESDPETAVQKAKEWVKIHNKVKQG